MIFEFQIHCMHRILLLTFHSHLIAYTVIIASLLSLQVDCPSQRKLSICDEEALTLDFPELLKILVPFADLTFLCALKLCTVKLDCRNHDI